MSGVFLMSAAVPAQQLEVSAHCPQTKFLLDVIGHLVTWDEKLVIMMVL